MSSTRVASLPLSLSLSSFFSKVAMWRCEWSMLSDRHWWASEWRDGSMSVKRAKAECDHSSCFFLPLFVSLGR